MAIRKSKTTYDSLAIFIPRKFFIYNFYFIGFLCLVINIRETCVGLEKNKQTNK